MNEWEVQVMYLIIVGTGFTLAFAALEACHMAFLHLRKRWWDIKRTQR